MLRQHNQGNSFMNLSLSLPLVVIGCCIQAAEPAMTQKEAESSIFRSWREVSVEHRGKAVKALYGVQFSKTGTEAWLLKGELSVSGNDGTKGKIVVDASSTPKRIDFLSLDKDGKVKSVKPCIFRFEKQRLTICEPDNASNTHHNDGNYDIRPIGFKSDDTNNYRVTVYEPCTYMSQD